MTDKQPLVSIVIPCYNHAQFVQETIQSVIDQDYDNIELIIIDDGSKDNSVEVIQQMIPACEERFKRFEFRYRPNKGLCATLNEALEWCEGEFFAPVASDDILMPYKTSVQVDYLQKNISSIGVFGGVEVVSVTAKNKKISRSKKYNFYDIFFHKHDLPAATQMLRLNSIVNVGGYREDLIIEDWSMWLFLTDKGGTLDYISMVFATYRRHLDNISSKRDVMWCGVKKVLLIYSSNDFYKKALSNAMLVEAHSRQSLNDSSALSFLLNAIKIYPLSFFSYSVFRYFAKFFIIK